MATPLEKVKQAADNLERARNVERASRQRLEKCIRLAYSDDHNISTIARKAGVSRATVYSILEDR